VTQTVLWVGPRAPPPQLGELLAQHDAGLEAYLDATAALAAVKGRPVAVAIVTCDHPAAPKFVEAFNTARPDVQVLIASESGVARDVVLALAYGASGVLEFKSQSKEEIVLEVRLWLTKSKLACKERDLLERLRALNEKFLKTIVAAEKRNIDLEQELAAVKRPAVAPDEGPAQVLIVDDEQVVHDVLQRVLSHCAVTSVLSAEEGLKLLWEKGFHLVITDKNLPGISGLELLEKVKELSPETEVVLITGYSSKDAAIDALNKGAAGYIEKPFDDVRLVRERIDAVLAKQKLEEKGRAYLTLIKERNRDFLDQYKVLRADLDAWMASRAPRE
jgi:DNA-binding NtrC family response regulator